MNFTDKTLVRLAEPSTRAAVFDSTALEQMAFAAYDTSEMTIEAPFNAVFDQLRFGIPVPRQTLAEGHWGALGGSDRSGANFNISGLSGEPLVANALWRGAIVARVAAPTGRITKVKTAWPDAAAIDREIVKSLGSLPSDSGQLAHERRARLSSVMKDNVSIPAVVTDTLVDRLLESTGAIDIQEYFARYSETTALGALKVTISADEVGPPTPQPLPLSAAILVRDSVADLAKLVADSHMIREQMESAGYGQSEAVGLRMLQRLLVVWVVPLNIFDDADWPGVDTNTRRAKAGSWLAREGIALAAVS